MEFLRFKRMMTPAIIEAVFWIGVIFTVTLGIVIITGTTVGPVGVRFTETFRVIFGGGLIVLGPIMLRLWCELVVIFFRLYEVQLSVDNRLAAMLATRSSPVAVSPEPLPAESSQHEIEEPEEQSDVREPVTITEPQTDQRDSRIVT